MGPALERRILQAYGSEAEFRAAIERLDLDRLLALEGLSERRAFEVVAQVRAGQGAELERSDRARDLRRDLQDQLAAYAQTTYGQRAIRLLPVLRDATQIHESVQRVLAMRDVVERTDSVAVARSLKPLGRWREAARASLGRLVVAESEADELTLRAKGVDRWCRIASGRDAVGEAADHPLVVYAARDGDLPLDETENVVRARVDDALWKLVPESEIAFVEANRSVLEALAELARLLDRPSAAPRVLQAVGGCSSTGRIDVAAAAEAALAHGQKVLAESIAGLSLAGAQILELLGSGLPRPLAEARSAAVAAGRAHFQALVGRNADPFAEGLPLRLDEEEVARLRSEFENVAAMRAFERAQGAARVVAEAREALRQELAHWLQFDVDYALGRYALEFESVEAVSSHRLSFEHAVNLRLARRERPQAISYEVGGDHPVAVLTGANSGGKSSLLELVTQLVLLHHWGLPVPARCAEIPVFEEVLLLAGARSADAGALESLLRELFPPLTRPGRKLLLLDEVEAITELEAAGRILGVFLDEVGRTDSLCVLVTHLPGEVLRHARAAVRFDGIDAVGLDERFNLLVDRQPKLNHRARSTPELILRRVHAKSQGAAKELFARVLGRFSRESE